MADGLADLSGRKKLRTLDEVAVDGKRVLVRVDFNVSPGKDGVVDEFEDYRIEAAIPTINELRQKRCKVILLTHLGRPQAAEGNFDLAPIKRRLEELLGEEIRTTKRLTGSEVETIVQSAEPGSVILLPNVREDEREETGNQKLAQDLAALADIYVNEAFSVSHRAHTSVAFVPYLLPSCAGRRTAEEVKILGKIHTNPEHPYIAITSGAKISTKVGMLRDLLTKVDKICLGGQLGNVFLAAQGKYPEEYYSADDIVAAKTMLRDGADKFVLPVDVVIGPEDGVSGEVKTVAVEALPPQTKGLWDIGPATVKLFVDLCAGAKTVMWNGPVGKFEIPAYAAATIYLAQHLATLKAFRVVGGGDTMNAIEQQRLTSKYDHVSVGGGAMIAYLEGKRMPGLEPLYQ
ncbi:MAG: phosphoglycerate kinase [Candidatus Andersenbacteria bacterium]